MVRPHFDFLTRHFDSIDGPMDTQDLGSDSLLPPILCASGRYERWNWW